MTTQTHKLAASEETKRNAYRSTLLTPDSKYLSPQANGQYVILPITTFDPYVIVAPFAPVETSVGGIVLPDAIRDKPEVGMVVGVWGDDCYVKIGQCVRYSPKNAICSVSADYPFYNGAKLHVIRRESVFSLLPQRSFIQAKEADIHAIV